MWLPQWSIARAYQEQKDDVTHVAILDTQASEGSSKVTRVLERQRDCSVSAPKRTWLAENDTRSWKSANLVGG